MAVTVTGGSGETVTVQSSGAVSAALFDTVADTINKAVAAGGFVAASGTNLPTPTVTGANSAVAVSVTGTVTVPAGYATLLYTNNAASLTIQAAAGLDVLSGTGGITYYGPTDGSGTAGVASVAAGGGNNLVSFQTATKYAVSLGEGADTVFANGSGLVDVGAGKNLVTTGSGTNTVFASGSADTIVAGTGSTTIGSGGDKASIFTGSGAALVAVGGANSTVSAGSGAATIFAGNQSVTFLNNSSSPLFIAPGNGASTVVGGTTQATIFGNPGSNLTYFSTKNGGSALLVAGAGSETINASGSEVGNTMFAGSNNSTLLGGSGADLLVASTGTGTLTGGAGADMFIFSKGQAGNFAITDFAKGTDSVVLSKYGANEVTTALASATTFNNSTQLSLSDGTKISFTGVTGLTSDLFKTN